MDTQLDRLYQHLAWADRLLLGALAKAVEPPEQVLRLLGHLLGAERIWLKRVRSEDSTQDTVWPALSLAQCGPVAVATSTGFQDFLRTATASQLAAPITYRTTKGQPMESILSDILLHVALHGAYHRGQIAALLRREGLEPISTDFITFARVQGELNRAETRGAI